MSNNIVFMGIPIKTMLFIVIFWVMIIIEVVNMIERALYYDKIEKFIDKLLINEKTILREFEPLLVIKDHYPKYVVSMDAHFNDNIEGVRHIGLYDFITSDTFI